MLLTIYLTNTSFALDFYEVILDEAEGQPRSQGFSLEGGNEVGFKILNWVKKPFMFFY